MENNELKKETTVEQTEETFELTMADVLKHRRSVKAAIETAKLVKGDQVKATKVDLKPAKS
jgi:hypothetical protein